MSQTFAKERNFFATTFGAGIKILHIYTANLNFCSKMVYICKKLCVLCVLRIIPAAVKFYRLSAGAIFHKSLYCIVP